jgi:hypothetical protein
MGWDQGTTGITKSPNQHDVAINIVKNYGQIDKPTLKAHCNEFCKATGAKFQTHAAQINHMMGQCLEKSLTAASLAHLKPYQAQYIFEGIKYALLMYKTNMRLATIDSIATTNTLHTNLNNLPAYAASVNGNVNIINSYFDTNYTQILAGNLLLTTLLPSCLMLTSQSPTTTSTFPRGKMTTMAETYMPTSCTRILWRKKPPSLLTSRSA